MHAVKYNIATGRSSSCNEAHHTVRTGEDHYGFFFQVKAALEGVWIDIKD